MPPANTCSVHCADPCVDWHDWEKCRDCHRPYHYWRWDANAPELSERRLGERVYICACLLWTALHDRRLGHQLFDRHPNWSAVCNYYSIVHSLRLFWFTLYGSYPSGHSELTKGLQDGESGARADWKKDELRPGRKRICSTAFQGLLKERSAVELAHQVSPIGQMFESARMLRNDSNYESLILAHQYSHRYAAVHIPDEMNRTAIAMSSASSLALRFMSRVLESVFHGSSPWIGSGSSYSGADLKNLLWRYVYQKIESATDASERTGAGIHAWFQDTPELEMSIKDSHKQDANPAQQLVQHIRFDVFSVKRDIMMGFVNKVESLRDAVQQMVRASNHQVDPKL